MVNEKIEAIMKGFVDDGKREHGDLGVYLDTKIETPLVQGQEVRVQPMGKHHGVGRPFHLDLCWPDRFWGKLNFWSISEEQASFITGLLMATRPKIVFETGTNQGRATRAIMDALVGTGAKLHTVDIHDYWPNHKWSPLKDEQIPQVIRYIGKSPEILEDIRLDGKIDFAMLDGAHDYETVLAELYFVKDNANENCLVLVDNFKDEAWPGVEKAVLEFNLPYVFLDSYTGMALISL